MSKLFDDIRAILFDVDGVLTDGVISINEYGVESLSFNVKDGQLVGFMKKNGFIFGAISGRNSSCARKRLEALQIDFIALGIHNKLIPFEEFCSLYRIPPASICYIGDDVIDIPVLRRVGVSVAPSDASKAVLTLAKFVSSCRGGSGVLREVIDEVILQNQDLQYAFAQMYCN